MTKCEEVLRYIIILLTVAESLTKKCGGETMTEQDAINYFKCYLEWCEKGGIGVPSKESFETAIFALEQIQRYLELGTVEECREAVEKQRKKKPDFEGDGYDGAGNMIYDTWICPCCNKDYEVDYNKYDYCPNCGQKLDFSVEDE